MRARVWLSSVLFLFLAGCGYVGPVLPPSPMLPDPVNDLTVIERGDQLVIRYSIPVRTTDLLIIRDFNTIDLRIGEAAIPFRFPVWETTAKQLDVELPPETDPDNPLPIPMESTISARDWVGKRIAVAVRTSVRKKDHFSSWSNRGVLEVLPPMQPPVVTFESTAQGVLLKWASEGDDVRYRIYRGALLGESDKPEYLDTTSQFQTPYNYTVVAFKGAVESLPSQPLPVTTVDTFPPSVPTGVTALAGPSTIEVSWQRSPESDLKGYYIYRSVDNAPYQQLGGLLTVPTYSDHDVQHGKTYRYQINAIDQNNNPSEKSEPAQVTY